MKKSNWETETCTRCRGTGHYSSHILYGTRCFKCGGAKILFTKRGKAAKKYFQESLKVDVSKIKLGDLIWEDDGWYRVQEITHIGISKGTVSGVPFEHQIYGFRIGAEYTTRSCKNVKRYPQDENGKPCKVAFKKNLAKALEYQSKLGKHGKVLKKYLDVK